MYQDYYSSSSNGFAAWGLRTDILESLDLDLNNCSYYTDLYGVSVSEIVEWNPSLEADNCTFSPGYSYCIVKSWNDAASASSNTTLSECETIQTSWIVDGTASDCTSYVAIYGYYNTTLTCETIDTGVNNITEFTLLALNPWIGTGNCTTGLFSGLDSDSQRAPQAPAIFPTPVSNTATLTATSNAATSTTSATASTTMEPGYASNCDKIHQVISGDSCSAIASEYGITLAQFSMIGTRTSVIPVLICGWDTESALVFR
ncbi:hypothetical protein BO71DRAFT_436431 [Aspergillus ellipticus CBS 707.79]|uniref:LysM domain-containing protein n=1 Tax=Aspergillus ellipticus CBS 707.79 TaxID=1448320 RepID=A0A319CR15_9EURO|nr:hypothetical protein BO71DRAFT_436431 [Aspergillus ellipticus CBS 707.79]